MKKIYGVIFLILILVQCSDNEREEFSRDDVIKNALVYKFDKEYCAFCDIITYNEKYYIAFRVGENHVPYNEYQKNGYIKIMSSKDTEIWEEELNIVNENFDLRDPCLCLNREKNELTLSYGLYNFSDPSPSIKNERVVLSEGNEKLYVSEVNMINVGEYSHYWLWKIYYEQNKYWSVGYNGNEKPILVSSENGIDYKLISEIPVKGNETALVFFDNRIYAISRNVEKYSNAYCSYSEPPYTSWSVNILNEFIASPEIAKANNNKIYVAGRSEYGVSIYTFDPSRMVLDKFFNLFAKASNLGNVGYPGMIFNNQRLFITYYACNDNDEFPSIYVTSIRL